MSLRRSLRRYGGERFSLWVAAAVVLLSLLAARSARAQVNAESLRHKILKPGIGIHLETSLAAARGNVELLDLSASGQIRYQTLYPVPEPPPGEEAPLPFVRQRVFVTGSGRFAESPAGPFVSQTYLHMRWTGMWHRRAGSDVFLQHQYNRFFRLLQRNLAGAGARFEMVHDPMFLWWGGTAYMIEYERINVQPGAPDARETLSHRWTSYLTERFSFLGGRFLMQSTTYIQPRLDDFSDYRILQEVEVQGKMTELIGFGVNLSILHDSAPPTGVKSTDMRLSTSVSLSL